MKYKLFRVEIVHEIMVVAESNLEAETAAVNVDHNELGDPEAISYETENADEEWMGSLPFSLLELEEKYRDLTVREWVDELRKEKRATEEARKLEAVQEKLDL